MSRKRLDGFTLIELLIVVAIAGILGSIALFSAGGITEGYRLKNAVVNVMGDMKKARSRAVSRNKTVMVQFLSSTDYNIQQDGEILKVVMISEGVTASPVESINFYPNGTAKGTLKYTFQKEDKTMFICINKITGHTRVCDENS